MEVTLFFKYGENQSTFFFPDEKLMHSQVPKDVWLAFYSLKVCMYFL